MNAESLPLLGVVLIVASAGLAVVALLLARRREPEEAPEDKPEASAAASEPAAAPVMPTVPADRMIPVASLFRDEVSGGLVVRVGERDYRSAAELLTSRDRQRIEYTLAELNRWFSTAPGKPAEREPVRTAKPETGRQPLTMVQEINLILERKLRELPETRRAVRLVEGSGGAVRVYVGVDAYNGVDEVPDLEIRRLIHEAVAEWESAQ